MSNDTTSPVAEYQCGSCDAILDTAKTVYNEEWERFKQLEAKTSIALAFAGLLLCAFFTYVIAFNPTSKDIGYLSYTFIVKTLILALFTIGAMFFLKAVSVQKFDRIELNNIINEDFAREDEASVKIQIAATYRDAINLNADKIEMKMTNYKRGLVGVSCGFLLFILHFVLEEVLKHAQ